MSLFGGTPFRLHRLRTLRLVLAVALLCVTGTASRAPGIEGPPPGFKVAFIGDQGAGAGAQAVLELIRDEGADAVIHSGDFDYQDDPAAWMALIDSVLGPDFPYFASVGNHDAGPFYGAGGYQELLEARMQRLGIPWTGDLGVQSFFHYQGILVVFTAPGVFGSGDADHALFIRDVLAADDSIWKLSSWHENMTDMQLGSKGNSTGWGVYEESRRGGAIIATAHEHSYSRTHLLSHVEQKTVASTEQPLVLSADDPGTTEDEGTSFVFVSGLGGHSVRNQDRDGYWWASRYTSDQGATYGALFGVFDHEGDPQLARFYFKDVAGVVADDFLVRSGASAPEPTVAIDDITVLEGDAGTQDAVFTVSLSFASEQDVRVGFSTADGTALSGSDFVPVSGVLLFQAGETTQAIHIPIVGDAVSEPAETFSVFLLNPEGATLAKALGTAILSDDDAQQTSLTLSVQGAGGVSLDPPGGVYDPGTLVTLTALPARGSEFAGWGGDLSGTQNPTVLVVDGDRSVTALFDPLPIALLEVQTGTATEAATVTTQAPLAAAEGDLYVAAIVFKPDVVVTDVSGLGLVWEPVAAQCSARGQTGVALWQASGQPLGDEVVTATLASVPRSALIAVSRYSGAERTGVPATANTLGVAGSCSGGTDGSAYALDLAVTTAGAQVQVAVAMRAQNHSPGSTWTEQAEIYAGSGGNMAGLSLALGSVDLPAVVSVDGSFDSSVDWAVAAVEIRRPVAPFSLTIGPSPGGSVGLDPPGGIYAAGTLVTVTATPDPGLLLSGWSGDLSGSDNPATLVMDGHKIVAARFGAMRSVTIAPGSGGGISLDPPGGAYLAGTIVRAQAIPDGGHLFRGWTGDLGGVQSPTLLAVDADKLIGATFARPVLTVDPGTHGSVTIDPPGGVYDAGSVVTLEAIPEAGFLFTGWSGDLSSGANPAALLVDADKSVAASFVPAVTVDVTPPSGGSVVLDPPGGVYPLGTTVQVTAIPDAVSLFRGWSGDLSGMENPTTLVLDGDKSLEASFGGALLDVTAGVGGGVTLDPPGPTYPLGSVVTLTANPDPGQLFTGWGGALTGSTNPATLVVDADKSVFASFIRAVTLGVGPSSGGSVVLDPPGGVYPLGSSVQVTAIPDAVSLFRGWSGDLSGSENPTTLVLDGDKSLEASFGGALLNVAAGQGGGVTLDPPGPTYPLGSVVTLTANPDPGQLFTGWGGALAGSENPANLVVDADKSVTAGFVLARSVTLEVLGDGSVALDPPGGLYAPGAIVTLTATPAPGFEFGGWGGDLASTANPATLLVDTDRSVDARFVPLPLDLAELQTGASADVASVATGTPLVAAEGDLYVAAVVTKSNTAVTGVSGLGLVWQPVAAQCSARGQTGVSLWQASGQPLGDEAVTASFAAIPRGALIAVSRYSGAVGAGAVTTANSLGVAGACSGGTDSVAYAFDLDTTTADSDLVVVAAMRTRDHVPGSAWTEQVEIYAGSGGGVAGLSQAVGVAGQPGPVRVDGSFGTPVDWSVAALEVRGAPASLALSIGSSPGGSVALDPPGGVYQSGTLVTLTATPDAGRLFTGWNGDLAGSGNPATLVMDAHKSVTAGFGTPHSVAVQTTAGGGVGLDPPGGVHAAGALVTLTATPDAGYLFRAWGSDLAGAENPTTLLVDADKSVSAFFAKPVLNVIARSHGTVTLEPPGGVYDAGTVVTLHASPKPGYVFSSWSGALSGGGNPATLTIDADKLVFGHFDREVELGVSASTGGSVDLDPPGGVYASGTHVTLTATPDAGTLFRTWGGDLAGTGNPATLLVDADKDVTAIFAKPVLRIVTRSRGSVTLDPPGGVYDVGSVVTLYASPDAGTLFTGWSGDLASSENPATLVMDGDRFVIAEFGEP